MGEQEDSSSCDAEQVCGQQAAAAQEIRDECETDLLQALPALRSAVEALKELTSSDIVVVKSMKKPPEGVKLVLAAVCIVLKVNNHAPSPRLCVVSRCSQAWWVCPRQVKPDTKDRRTGKPDYWRAAQKNLLNDTRFVKRLRTYDKDKMSGMFCVLCA